MKNITIKNRTIGLDHPTYFIADIGANHDGDMGRAIELIHLCAESGVDAAKFQNFHASKIVSKQGFDQMKGQLSHQSSWKKSVYEVYDDASVSETWTRELKKNM